MPKLVQIFISALLGSLILSGCGGGGGGGGSEPSTPGGGSFGTDTPLNPSSQSNVAAVISGSLQTFLGSANVNASMNRAFSRIRFAKSSVALKNTRTTQALSSTEVGLLAVRNNQAPIRLGEAQTGDDGRYTLVIYQSALKTIPCQDPSITTPDFCITNWREFLSLPNPGYRLRLSFNRPASSRREAINSTIDFRPVVNDTILQSGSQTDLRVNAMLDSQESSNGARLEVEADEGTLVVESNVDINSDGQPSSQPLNIFRRKTSSSSASSVEVIEIDVNGDGTFGEESDAVPARVFLAEEDLSSPEFSDILNSTVSSFLDTSGDGKPNKVTDDTSPVIQFVSPTAEQIVARNPMTIRIQYGDDLGFELGSLRISASRSLKLTNPFQRIQAGTTGARTLSAKFAKRRLPKAEVAPGPLSSATSDWMLGEAVFTIADPLDAFGPGPVTLNVTLDNFSQNSTARSINLTLPFVVDGPPELNQSFTSITGTEGLNYNGFSQNQFITIRDVLPITLGVDVIPSSDRSRLGWLNLNVDGTSSAQTLNLGSSSELEITEDLFTATDKREFRIYFSGRIPQNFKSAPTLQIRASDRDSNTSVRSTGMDIRAENALPQWNKVCILPDQNSNPLNNTPQNACSQATLTPSEGRCQTDGGNFVLPEKEPSIVVLCATDEDTEDNLQFRLASIKYQSQNPALPSTQSLQGVNPEFEVMQNLPSSGYRVDDNTVIDSPQSTLAIFRWTPPNLYGLSPTDLKFETSDGASPHTSLTVEINVTTVEDAPVISSLSASGTVSAVGAYGEPGISSLAGDTEFRQWLDSATGLPKVINARQGVPYNLVLFASDDETSDPQTSLFDSGFLADTSGNPVPSAWLTRQNATGEDRLSKIVFSGTPSNNDVLQSRRITVITTDPTQASNPLSRRYQIALDVLDQNDAPRFSASPSDALTDAPLTLASTSQSSANITVPATEDQKLIFYIHAFDVDPTGSPYLDADQFTFNRNEDNLSTKISRAEVVTSPGGDKSRAYMRMEWTPQTQDTNENIPTGVNQIQNNPLEISVRATCPTTPFYRIQCVEPIATVDVTLAVQAVDEGPKFERLTVNGVLNQGTEPIRLIQGEAADIVQFVREEEAGQQFEDIEVIASDPTLSFLLNNISKSLNDGNVLGSSLRLQGVPPNDAVDYETRIIDGVAREVPRVVSLTMRATPAGSSLITTKTLQFEIEDRPDAPTFTGLPNPPILTISEDQSLSLSLAATNNLDKDPQFQQGFLFRSVSGELPSPAGNFSVTSETTSTNTTGLLSWTPDQSHANGTNSKAHLVGLEVCLQAAPNVCRQQQLTINVLPVDDPPVILFGASERNLIENPHNAQNPFPIQENSNFSQKIRAYDPDGEQIRLSAWYELKSPASVPGRNGVSVNAHQSLVSGPMADIFPVSEAFSTQPNEPGESLNLDVRWDGVDHYYIGSDPTQLSTATYHLYIKATPLGAASASTLATVVLNLQSVNDAPFFTTRTITNVLEQNSAPGSTIVTLSEIATDEESNPVFYTITERYGATPSFVNQTVTTDSEITFSQTPGENNVGLHRLQIRIQENIQNSLTRVDDIEFRISDSNDSPSFTNLLAQTTQQVQEGSQSVVQLILNDSDLGSSPALETITYAFSYSTDNVSFAPLSFTSSASTSSTIYTTEHPWTLGWGELPINSELATTGVSLVFAPKSLPGFTPATYALRIQATDSFESQFLSDTTSLTWQIQPFDNVPRFLSANSRGVATGSSATLLCLQSPCDQNLSSVLNHSQTATLSVTAYNDEAAANDPVTFFPISAWGETRLTTTPAGITRIATGLSGTSTWSADYLITPSNSRVGFNTMAIEVADFSDGAARSVNVEQSATHTFAWFVQDVADVPTFQKVRCSSPGCSIETNRIDVLEDTILRLQLTIDDADLHSPKTFSTQDLAYMQNAFGIQASSANQLASTLFHPEFFEYVSTNTTTLPGFRISHPANTATTLFAFSTPSNLIATATTSTILMEWTSTTAEYTQPVLGQDVNLNLRVRSFAAATVDASRPTSFTTSLRIRVLPVNDAPRILNTQTEAQATEGQPFSFQIDAEDEEESSLSYLFATTKPPGLSILPSGLMEWVPTNDDTIQNFYDLGIYAQDTGVISSASTTIATVLSSPIYNLRLVLNDVDAPALHDSTYTPLTTATEDQIYTSQIRFSDEDKFDIPHYYLDSITRNGTPVATAVSGFNIQERDNQIGGDGRGPVDINWTPNRGGTWSIRIRVDSIKNAIVRSSAYYNYNVQVAEVNDPPLFADTAIRTVEENKPYLWNIEVTDQDGDTPFLSLQDSAGCTIPSFLNLDEVNKTLSGQTNLAGQEGTELSLGSFPVTTYKICLAADDGIATTTYSFDLEVFAINNPPTILSLASQPDGEPTSTSQDRNTLLQSVEPIEYSLPQVRPILLKEGLNNTIRLNFDDEEGDTPQSFALKQAPPGVSVNSTQSTSRMAHLTLSWTPGPDNVNIANSGNPVAGREPALFRIEARDQRDAATELEFLANVVDQPTPPCSRLVNPSCSAGAGMTTMVRNINEDQSQSVSLQAIDFDPEAVLSFSIVTSVTQHPHPTQPVYSWGVNSNPKLELNIDNAGEVTFLPKISEANILGTSASVSNLVPVTLSICGTSRSILGFTDDCTTATYRYRIQAFDDLPVFNPSFPVTRKTTAAEGSDYLGLSIRRVQSETHCTLNDLQLEEICVTDEESITGSHIATDSSDFKFNLRVSNPTVPPAGLQLSTGEPQCLSTTGTNAACLNGYTCDACTSHHYTVVQTLAWSQIDYLQPRSRNISIRAEERANANRFTDFNFTLDIANTNRPPVINNSEPLVPLQVTEGVPFSLNIPDFSRDDDGDTLVYRLLRSISGMEVNSSTGLLSWTPAKHHIGKHILILSVQDKNPTTGTLMSQTTAVQEITVKPTNNPPRLDPALRNINNSDQIISQTLTQDQFFEAQILAFDEEGDTFSFSDRFADGTRLNGNALPSGMLLSSFGRLSWTPGNADVGANTLTVVARDDSKPNSPFASQAFELTVLDVNDPPVITNKDFTQDLIVEDEKFTRQITFADIDSSDQHFFGVSSSPSVSGLLSSSGLPVLTVNQTGLVSFHPNSDMAGVYNITARVQDIGGGTDAHTYTITVNSANNPPVLEDIPDLYVSRDASQYTIQLHATDPEGDDISYFFASTPANLSINQQSGIINITEKLSAESQEFFVYARDSSGNQSPQEKIQIRYVDAQVQIPRIVSPAPTIAKILREYRYQPEIESSGENQKIEIVETARFPRPEGLTSNNSEIIWTPQIADLGTHLIRLRAVATIGGQEVKSVPQRYFLNVTNQNQAPVLTLATDVNNVPISTFDATENVAVERVVATLTEYDLEDSERFQLFFNNANRSDEDTSHPGSDAVARVTLNPDPIETNPIKLQVLLNWTPDNAAAFANQLGYVNTFSIVASDGITDSNVVTLTVNVTNTNNVPQFYPDENQAESEIAYVGETYRRDFFARDLDGQITYFCLDTTAKEAEQEQYPGLQLSLDDTGITLNPDNRFRLNGQGDYISGAAVPPNALCRLGSEVTGLDPNERRGKLSKITVEYDPIDEDITVPTHSPLPLIGYDFVSPSNANLDFTFTTKLAPTISSLNPSAQFRGREVVVAGGGILNLSQPLVAKFLKGDGTITATTSVYGITTTGVGRMKIPDSAETGYVSIGYSDFSSPVPFTVLNGETSAIAGFTQTDTLSAPAGFVTTFSPSGDREWMFVSDFERHTIHFYELASGLTPTINNMAVNPDQILNSRIVGGALGSPGDQPGATGTNRLYQPTGLSLARHQGTTWLLIADTGNHKIKAMDLTDLYRNPQDSTNGMPVYDLVRSTHLYRPYKAIQHPDPALEDRFYIANTYGNTVELFDASIYDAYGTRSLDQMNLAPITDIRPASEFTTTIAGSGFSSSANGALLKPVDLQVTGTDLLISSYSGPPQGFVNSSTIHTRNIANRNDDNATYNGELLAMSTGRLTPATYHAGEHLVTIQSTRDDLRKSLGFQAVLSSAIPLGDDDVVTGNIYSSSQALLNSTPGFNLNSALLAVKNSAASTQTVTSQGQYLWQSKEIQFQNTVSSMDTLQNPAEGSYASAWASVKTSEARVSPIDENQTLKVSGFEDFDLPAEISFFELGKPTLYDGNRDRIADLWLPVPTIGTVFVFPGIEESPSSPNLRFNFESYWKVTSESIGCGPSNCLQGVQHANFGRVFTGSSEPSSFINTVTVGSEDLILSADASSQVHYIEAYYSSLDVTNMSLYSTLSTNFQTTAQKHFEAMQTTNEREAAYQDALTQVAENSAEDPNANLGDGSQCATPSTSAVSEPIAVDGSQATYSFIDDTAFDSIVNVVSETSACIAYKDYLYAQGLEAQYLDNLQHWESQGMALYATPSLMQGLDYENAPSDPTFWIRESPAPGGAVVDFDSADYARYSIIYEGGFTPYHAYAGTFSSYALDKTCINGVESVVGGISICKQNQDGSLQLIDDFLFNYNVGDFPLVYKSRNGNQIETAISGMQAYAVDSSIEVYLRSMEQIVNVGAPNESDAQQVLITNLEHFVGTDGGSVQGSSNTVGNAQSPIKVGQPFARAGTKLFNVIGTRGENTHEQYTYAGVNPYVKADSVMFISANGQLNFFDIQRTVTAEDANIDYQIAETKTAVPLYAPGQSTALSPGDFVFWDFNKDGITDLASLHPEERLLTVRLGTASNPAFATNQISQVQALDTLEEPTTISVIMGSSKEYVDLVVANKGNDAITVFKAENDDRDNIDQLRLFQPGVHFNTGSKGNLFAAASFRPQNYFGGFGADPTSDVAMKDGLAFTNDYFYGPGSVSDVPGVHYGAKQTIQTTQAPFGSMLVIRRDPRFRTPQVSMLDMEEELILRSTAGYFATSEPSIIEALNLTADSIEDLVTLDVVNQQFSVNLSVNTTKGFVHDPETQLYELQGQPSAVVAADFNLRLDDFSNLYNDLAITLFDRDSVLLKFNGGQSTNRSLNPTYTFNHTAYPEREIAVGNGPVDLDYADFNRDGYLDLAIANSIGNNLCILYNKPANPGDFEPCVFYPTQISPQTVIAMDVHNRVGSGIAEANQWIDLVVMNAKSGTVQVFINSGNGFRTPISYRIRDFFPAEDVLKDPQTDLRLEPFLQEHIQMQAADFGNVVQTPQIPSTENPRYKNLLIANESNILTMKSLGDLSLPSYRSAISRYEIDGTGRLLTHQETHTTTSGVIKSLAVSGTEVYLSRSSLSDTLWATNPVSQESSVYLTGYIERATANNLGGGTTLSRTLTPTETWAYNNSALNLRQDDLGSAFEALQAVEHPLKGSLLYAAHSGTNKGILRYSESGAFEHVIGSYKRTPTSQNLNPYLGENLSLQSPAGMTLDPSGSNLAVADSGNGWIRLIDLNSNIVRTMAVGGDPILAYPGIFDITNQYNTFNYWAIDSNRLYFINPSEQPITMATQTLDTGLSLIESGLEAFEIEGYQNQLYVGARDNSLQPAQGRLYRLNLSATPITRTTIALKVPDTVGTQDYTIQGLTGFTLNQNATRLFFGEWQTRQIKMIDLTVSGNSVNITTLAGITGVQGHYDGSTEFALLREPGAMQLNEAENRLYFVDGTTIRSLNLENLGTGQPLVLDTVSGNPYDTGIINAAGTDSRYIKPEKLETTSKGDQDVIYVSDSKAHNIRKIVLDK